MACIVPRHPFAARMEWAADYDLHRSLSSLTLPSRFLLVGVSLTNLSAARIKSGNDTRGICSKVVASEASHIHNQRGQLCKIRYRLKPRKPPQ